MAPPPVKKWTPSVSFYFRVMFQRLEGPNFQASFQEVSGLSWDLGKRVCRGNDGNLQAVPTGITYTNVTLKRPLGPLSGSIAGWLKECHDFLYCTQKKKDMKRIRTYDVVIQLLDEEANIQAAWQCLKAYPMKWSMGGFNSEKNELASETIELAYGRLDRIK